MVVAFCGIDGSGKSSHLMETARWLNDNDVSNYICKPLRTESAFYNSYRELTEEYNKKYNERFPNEYGTALLAMQLLCKNNDIIEYSNSSEVVLLDRWIYSHYAYARKCEAKIMQVILERCVKPDLVFLFDLPEYVALERIDNERGNRTINESEEVGENASAHSSGIHQDGLLKSREVYEIINPKDVGLEDMELVLTARSGRHAVKAIIEKMGYSDLTEESFEHLHHEFLKLADKKKEIYYHDLYYLLQEFGEKVSENFSIDDIPKKTVKIYVLTNYQVISSDIFPSASVELTCEGERYVNTSAGNGPIDALYTVIREIVGYQVKLKEYNTSSISQGKEAMGRVRVKVEYNDKIYSSSATDTDTLKASAIAFLNCVNQIEIESV